MRSDINEDRDRAQDFSLSSGDTENLSYLWGEYSYRHDLCWKTAFRVTTVTVLLPICGTS